ncbi:hypothetical protein [Streptomyces sp. NBC_00289]|uniref:hypothetical protein n=1 Tax=Streptomyces sp. NBC_00289 TaxID=2975703 RepID=UPI00352C534A
MGVGHGQEAAAQVAQPSVGAPGEAVHRPAVGVHVVVEATVQAGGCVPCMVEDRGQLVVAVEDEPQTLAHPSPPRSWACWWLSIQAASSSNRSSVRESTSSGVRWR